MTHPLLSRWFLASAGALLLLLLLLLGGAACSGLTDIDTPDVVTPPQLDSPAGAGVLRVGAITKFAEAVTVPNSDVGHVAASGMMADEFLSTFTNRHADFRVSDATTPSGDGQIHLARVNLLRAITALQQFAPEPPSRIGQLFALVGYTELFFGESFCSGVPLGAVVGGQPVFGEQLTTVQMFERAIADFDSALGYSGGSEPVANLARVGRGRALLNLDRVADAAAAVAAVPTPYSYATEHSAAVQPNGLFAAFYTLRSLTVSNREGTNGLDFVSANDPRVPTVNVGVGADRVTPVYAFTKYSTAAAPVVIASGVEARLIAAEAALRTNPDDGSWIGILNDLRATAIAPAMAPLADPGTPAARVDLLFRERAFWLFGTGHRHGDLRRLIRQYGRDSESVFPVGMYRGGILYGTAVNFDPSATELNNPNYTGCFNRDA